MASQSKAGHCYVNNSPNRCTIFEPHLAPLGRAKLRSPIVAIVSSTHKQTQPLPPDKRLTLRQLTARAFKRDAAENHQWSPARRGLWITQSFSATSTACSAIQENSCTESVDKSRIAQKLISCRKMLVAQASAGSIHRRFTWASPTTVNLPSSTLSFAICCGQTGGNRVFQREINLARLHVYPHHLDPDPVTQTIAGIAALAG